MARTDFHRLTVTAVEPLTDDAAAVTFEVPARLRDTFVFRPGQSLTVRRGSERRSYSICAAAGRAPRIGIREVAGGAVSGWLVRQVRPGDVVEVQAPTGSFTPDLTGLANTSDRRRLRHHAMILSCFSGLRSPSIPR